MDVPLDFWIECMKCHPALYRFKGLNGGRGDSHRDIFYKDVREACVASEEFMNEYMEDQAGWALEELKSELKADPPKMGEEDDYHVESYAQWLRVKRWYHWGAPENINHAPARKVIEKLEPPEGERTSVHGWGDGLDADGLRWAWSRDSQHPEYEWDAICADEPEYYLKEHPPIEMWSHAYEKGVPLEDVIFVCPGCNREPIEEKNVDLNPVRYMCGLCGAEACPDEGETLESWAAAVGVKLWPFKEKKEKADG